MAVEGQEKDLFFHGSSLVGVTFDEIKEGDNVTFEIEQSEKGPSATGVKRV
ncbi:MAG TPA: cold shock domain-containing protein [Patescibacteria group bacterium]|nr:cold shock domain-containing protein [Patescibacteria group bacterium]